MLQYFTEMKNRERSKMFTDNCISSFQTLFAQWCLRAARWPPFSIQIISYPWQKRAIWAASDPVVGFILPAAHRSILSSDTLLRTLSPIRTFCQWSTSALVVSIEHRAATSRWRCCSLNSRRPSNVFPPTAASNQCKVSWITSPMSWRNSTTALGCIIA